MAKEEIIGGLENAVARGESLEKAMQSLISAGYSPDDVKEASGYVSMGTIAKISSPENREIQEVNSESPHYPKLPSQAEVQVKPKKSKKIWIILLIILFVLIASGAAVFMLFGEQILNYLYPPAV